MSVPRGHAAALAETLEVFKGGTVKLTGLCRCLTNRHPRNPILLPDPTSPWEAYNVFNPAVIYHNRLFHMHATAEGLDWISRIGYAVNPDGVNWNRMRKPVLGPGDHTDCRGVEDPRVAEIDGTFYMTYTADGHGSAEGEPPLEGGILPMAARTRISSHGEPLGPMVRGEDNKDHVLFPRQINGRDAALHCRKPHVWLARSDDLVTWKEADMAPYLRAAAGPLGQQIGGQQRRPRSRLKKAGSASTTPTTKTTSTSWAC